MKYILLFAVVLFSTTGFAQKLKEDQTPAAVRSAWASEYPTIHGVKWEKEGDNFEAEFMSGGTEVSILMSADGKFLEKETEIPTDQLPAAVTSYLGGKFPGKTVKEASRIVKTDGTIIFEAELGGDDYLFDANGNFISEEED